MENTQRIKEDEERRNKSKQINKQTNSRKNLLNEFDLNPIVSKRIIKVNKCKFLSTTATATHRRYTVKMTTMK